MKIKAISLWQPWAEAIRVGAKRIETRSWSTRYRGWLAIHAAKRKIDKSDAAFLEFAEYQVGDLDMLEFGAVICVVKLTNCRPTEALIDDIDQQEELWGNYDARRWGLELHGPLLDINPAIPLRGHQGLFDWEVPEAVQARISRAEEARLWRTNVKPAE